MRKYIRQGWEPRGPLKVEPRGNPEARERGLDQARVGIAQAQGRFHFPGMQFPVLRISGCGGRFPPLRVRWSPRKIGSKPADRRSKPLLSKPADSRVLRTACEPGQSGSVMVTLVRLARAKTRPVSASDSVKNPSTMTAASYRHALCRTLRRHEHGAIPASVTLSFPLHVLFQVRQIRRKNRRRRLFKELRQRAAKPRKSSHCGESLRPQPLQC